MRVGLVCGFRGVILRQLIRAVGELFGLAGEAAEFQQVFLQVGKLYEGLFELGELLRGGFELLLGLANVIVLLLREVLVLVVASLLDLGFGLHQFVLCNLLGLVAKFVEQRVVLQLLGELLGSLGQRAQFALQLSDVLAVRRSVLFLGLN